LIERVERINWRARADNAQEMDQVASGLLEGESGPLAKAAMD